MVDSPNYPNPYGQNLSCTWTISGSNPTDEIELSFDMFEIKDASKSCVNNYLLIGDVTDVKNQIRYCNDKRPSYYFVSKTNSIVLKLVTDEKKHTSVGFTLVYRVHPTNKTLATTTLRK